MTRTARHQAILEIVRSQPVANQSQLVEALADRGIQATQATVSRDVRGLGLVKAPYQDGQRYVRPDEADALESASGFESLRVPFRQWVRAVSPVGSFFVVRTPAGHANAVAIAIDRAHLAEVSGTLAGDDTILVMVRDAADEASLRGRLQELIDAPD